MYDLALTSLYSQILKERYLYLRIQNIFLLPVMREICLRRRASVLRLFQRDLSLLADQHIHSSVFVKQLKLLHFLHPFPNLFQSFLSGKVLVKYLLLFIILRLKYKRAL